MKTLVALCLVIASVFADAPLPSNDESYLRYLNSLPVAYRTEVRDSANQFSESYGTHDGTEVSQQGVLKRTPDGLDNVLVLTGRYKFISKEGIPYEVNYVADEYGFRPVGAHLPVAPNPAPTS